MNTDKVLNFFKRFDKFKEDIVKEIEEKDDLDDSLVMDVSNFNYRLSNVLRQTRSWGKTLVKIKKFLDALEIELDQWESLKRKEIKDALVEELDQRKKAGKAAIDIRENDIKARMYEDPIYRKLKMRVAAIRYYYIHVETNCYWPSRNALNVLQMLNKFVVANEGSFSPEARLGEIKSDRKISI